MKDAEINVQCPKCSFKFQIPVGTTMSPLIDTEVARRVEETTKELLDAARQGAQKESDERNHLVIAARDKIIADMRAQTDDLRRKADASTQIIAGEVRELELEGLLKAAFGADRIRPVRKGVAGGDVLHEVIGPNQVPAGIILWESKACKSWSNDWISKIKRDTRDANAAMSVIATAAMPKDVELFERIDGVYVVSVRCVLPLARILRQLLIDLSTIRAAASVGDGRAEKLLDYMASRKFGNRVLAIMEASTALQADLDSEKRSTARRWARMQLHIDAVAVEIDSMYGDLQVLVGDALPARTSPLALDAGAESRRRAS